MPHGLGGLRGQRGGMSYGKGIWETHPCHPAWAACRVNGMEVATARVFEGGDHAIYLGQLGTLKG